MNCEFVWSFVGSSKTPHNEEFDELRTEEIDKGGLTVAPPFSRQLKSCSFAKEFLRSMKSSLVCTLRLSSNKLGEQEFLSSRLIVDEIPAKFCGLLNGGADAYLIS
ncbi:hypothetical protein LIER_07376 [Lithospermum erythrorhizon]|uniref:Uncharacterized protein n=1 Tax=Lithospermum erythrorhizon TaxID=34254 RepID=A0AAV3P9J1_LITER